MTNTYCMFKGTLKCGAPFFDSYQANPHYVIRVTGPSGSDFDIVVNSASTAAQGGDNRVYSSIDLHFSDPIIDKLKALSPGLYTQNFPKLDYFQDTSLVNLKAMRPIPYEDANGNRFDINDQVDQLLTIDESRPSQNLPFNNGKNTQVRKFWTPTNSGPVIVYGFGFLFEPQENGLHETHMNQGNPKNGGHANENGAYQDGAVIVQIGDAFTAMFTAFQTQYLPTDATGTPEPNAVALPNYIMR